MTQTMHLKSVVMVINTDFCSSMCFSIISQSQDLTLGFNVFSRAYFMDAQTLHLVNLFSCIKIIK